MSKKMYILIFALAAIIIAGIVIAIVVLVRQDGFDKEITLTEGGVTQDEMQFNLEGMYPGQSVEYPVYFGETSGETYELTLSFRANGNVELAQYISLELELNGEKVTNGGLAVYLNGEAVSLMLPPRDKSVLIFRYSMPLEVENEAQGLTADFAVEIKASPAV